MVAIELFSFLSLQRHKAAPKIFTYIPFTCCWLPHSARISSWIATDSLHSMNHFPYNSNPGEDGNVEEQKRSCLTTIPQPESVRLITDSFRGRRAANALSECLQRKFTIEMPIQLCQRNGAPVIKATGIVVLGFSITSIDGDNSSLIVITAWRISHNHPKMS